MKFLQQENILTISDRQKKLEGICNSAIVCLCVVRSDFHWCWLSV